mgnify:CR=1 FL=1
MSERPELDAEDLIILRIEAIRTKQRGRWSLEHDRRHEPWEWLGLIATYAAAGRYEDAAALCVAASLSGAVKESAHAE